MNCSDIDNIMHEYFDNELSKEQQSFLFTHLAQCEECKTNFKALNRVQHEFRKDESELPEQLEERIFNTIRNKERRVANHSSQKRLPTYLIYGYGVLMTIISVFMTYQFFDLKKETLNYKENFEMTIEQINAQKKQISALINELPAVKVKASVDNPDLLTKGILESL
ncbi:MAG: zf-HC2 domain-containing protein [Ignavibacteriaceae bacterium]|nr:zf-HC2 domain-containing protein [Ignavibacteriaceae bacterium]